MAKRDADGFYYIVGRKKRFLKIFGSRVNLDETERLVKSSFSDLDAACAGKDDAMYVFITDSTKEKRFRSSWKRK
jgi:acyl-coenzyme A synthetase/AMP-(fatty) acid ligase